MNNLKQTVKEAILKSLDDIKGTANSMDICSHIIKHQYYDFSKAKTPAMTVSAQLGDLIRNGDARIKRIKQPNGIYLYYLTKNEENIGVETLNQVTEKESPKTDKAKSYHERDLHKLLSSYLKNTHIYSKTILHELSTYGKDSNHKWIHPDMVGIQFLNVETKASQNFLKAIHSVDICKLSSYEIKREISSDSELKRTFFQAVSNSSWANFGYLVAFEFGNNLQEEIKRLSQLFGIGIIQLNANPYESKVLFPATESNLDFKTIDKLCKINKDFEKFIEQAEKLMTAEERYHNSTEKEFDEFCDDYFESGSDTEVKAYCKDKNIPYEPE